MDEKTALKFIQAFRQEIEAITLQARVSIEDGIGINNDPDAGRDSWKSLDLYVDTVFLSGWPTSKNDPDTFAFAEVPLNNPLLVPLSDGCLPVRWVEISRLPEYVCHMAATVLNGQQFRVRLIPTEQELVLAAMESYADRDNRYGDDLGKWEFLSDCDCLEAWNKYGSVPILLGERNLEEVFQEEILDRLKRAVVPK